MEITGQIRKSVCTKMQDPGDTRSPTVLPAGKGACCVLSRKSTRFLVFLCLFVGLPVCLFFFSVSCVIIVKYMGSLKQRENKRVFLS